MAVTNAANDVRPSRLRENAVSACKPVDGMNDVGLVLSKNAAELETAGDIESAGAIDNRHGVAELPVTVHQYGLTFAERQMTRTGAHSVPRSCRSSSSVWCWAPPKPR